MSVPIEILLAHSDWVRRLAVELTGDPALADDLVQETWTSALRRGPREASAPRAWLATLLRRHLRQFRRGEGRRSAREAAVARPCTQDAPVGDDVEHRERRRVLIEAVLALPEPYRSTVLERFFQGRTVEEIAVRSGLSISTVSSRLTRGLARLRERLASRRERWLSAWGPFLRRPGERGPRPSQPVLRVAASVTGALAVAGWALGAGGGRDALAPVAHTDELRVAAEPRAALATPTVQALAARKALATRTMDSTGSPPRVRGLALDWQGQPLAGLAIGLERDGEPLDADPVVTDAHGGFLLPADPRATTVVACDERFVTIMKGLLDADRDVRLVAAPRLDVGGRVLDEAGQPIAGARVVWLMDHLIPVSYRHALDFTEPQMWSTSSDADGRYAFLGVPDTEASRVHVNAIGFRGREVSIEELKRDPDVRLEPPRPLFGRVRGRVVDEDGRPVAGAVVSLAPLQTRSDARGDFELSLGMRPPGRDLIATCGAHGGRLSLEHDPLDSTEPVLLRLAAPGAIEGSVLDARGRPVPDARVWLVDPSWLGHGDHGPVQAEATLAGREDESWCPVACDATGRFRLEGLLDRAYRVVASDAFGRVVRMQTDVHAGDRLDFQLDASADATPCSGRVVDSHGRPIEGVEVVRLLPVVDVRWGPYRQRRELPDEPVRTDADGRFRLPPSDARGALLRLRGEAVLPVDLPLQRGPAEPTYRASRRAHLQVRLAEPFDRADQFEVRDAEDHTLVVIQLRERCSHPFDRADLVDGRSLVLVTPETATSVVLFRDDQEVARVPVTPTPGRTTIVHW